MPTVSEAVAMQQRERTIKAYQRAVAALDELRDAVNGHTLCPHEKRVEQSERVNQAMVFVRRAAANIGIPRPKDQSPMVREEFMQQCHKVYRSRQGA